MSTVASIDKYFAIRGIQDDIVLVSYSQDVDVVRDHVYKQDVNLDDYGSFYVYAIPGEVLLIWGISPRNVYVDLIYSAYAPLDCQTIKAQGETIMSDKSYGWHNYPLLPVSELNRLGIETTFDHNARLRRESERYQCENRYGYWSNMSDGAYCLLRAAYMAYTYEDATLDLMRHYNPKRRDVKTAQQRIVDSHWKTFVDLSRLYARMNKPE